MPKMLESRYLPVLKGFASEGAGWPIGAGSDQPGKENESTDFTD